MEIHTCHICLGSNVSAAYIRVAREYLTRLFPDIVFGKETYTSPIKLANPACFTNQTACFTSILSPEEVRAVLKHLEKRAGRTAQETNREIVRLDIDLVKYDDHLFKKEDWDRFF